MDNHSTVKVLNAANLGNVAGDAEIDKHIVQRRELGWIQAADDVEATAQVDVLGDSNEPVLGDWPRWIGAIGSVRRRHSLSEQLA